MKCFVKSCSNSTVGHGITVRERKPHQVEYFCKAHEQAYWEAYLNEKRTAIGTYSAPTGATPFELDLMLARPDAQKDTSVLREVQGERLVLLPTNYAEGCVLWYAIERSPYKHLFIYVVLDRVIKSFGGTLLHVVIDTFNEQGLLEATVAIARDQSTSTFRIRPSDGLALAIAAGLPYLVTEEVLARIAATGKYGRPQRPNGT